MVRSKNSSSARCFFSLLSFQFPVQPPQIGTAIVPAVLQNALHNAGEISDDLFPVQLYGRYSTL